MYEKGTVSGFTGVNRFNGHFTPQGERLFGPGLATTRRAGPPAAMKLEAAFLQAMQDVNQSKVKRDRLTFIPPSVLPANGPRLAAVGLPGDAARVGIFIGTEDGPYG